MMRNSQTLAIVRDFFSNVGYAGLILPNGWFGRPHDNLLRLTRAEAAEGQLLLELEGQLLLTFAGEPRAISTARGLKLSGFTTVTWDWTEFGSATSHHEQWESGTVELIAPMG